MSVFLKKAIMSTLAVGALLSASDAFASCGETSGIPCLPPVDADPGPWYPPPPPDPDYGDDNGDPSGGDGGSGSGTGSTSPTDSKTCSELTNTKPHGCTDKLASQGLPRPTSVLPTEWLDIMSESLRYRAQVNSALDALAACYGDASKEADDCEGAFMTAVIPRSAVDTGIWADGYASISTTIAMAQNLRTYAEWLGIYGSDFSLTYVIGEASFDFGPAAEWLASFNSFNASFYDSRLRKACSFWVQAWNQAGCSN